MNPKPLSPLQLNHSLFTDVKITAQHLTDAEMQGTLQTAVEFRIQPDPNNRRIWQVIVRVHLQSPPNAKAPYIGTVESAGMFSVAPDWPEEKIDQLVAVNGTGLLYSGIREMVCSITSRGPWGMIMIPTQSFLGAYEDSKKNKGATAPIAATT